ncbi:MAG: hypothetical protein ACREO3_02675 [Arenimonas sp.]
MRKSTIRTKRRPHFSHPALVHPGGTMNLEAAMKIGALLLFAVPWLALLILARA